MKEAVKGFRSKDLRCFNDFRDHAAIKKELAENGMSRGAKHQDKLSKVRYA